jgi:DNA invertase Pin-like site-specific DNA recombinase
MAKAFSYIRFSSKKQASGDSLRRQLDMARAFANKNGLELDESTYQDLGISGFDKSNLEKGALSAFLRAVKGGQIQAGTYLLIEQFDRLSRAELSTAVRLLLDLVSAGITVVTLVDDRVWDKAAVNDMPNLLMSVVLMSRAREESVAKSDRLSAIWNQKRKNAGHKIVTSECPKWLEISEDKTHFLVLEDKLESVKKVFALRLLGVGVSAIVNRANRESWAAPSKSGTWHLSLVKRLLCNRALLGEYQPKTKTDDGKRIPIGDPYPNYYPSVIDESIFLRAKSISARKSTLPHRRDKDYRNVLQGLLQCSCGSSFVRKNKASQKNPAHYARYYCSDRVRGLTKCRSVPAPDLEQTILHAISALTPRSFDNTSEELRLGRAEIEQLLVDVGTVEDRIERMAEAVAGSSTPIQSLVEKLVQDEERLRSLHNRIEIAKGALANLDVEHPLVLFRQLARNLDTSSMEERSALREALLQVIDHIEVFPQAKQQAVKFHLRPGVYVIDTVGVAIQSPQALSNLDMTA